MVQKLGWFKWHSLSPDGFLLVIHTLNGNLYKIDLVKGEEVKLVNVTGGSLVFGDGLELLSPTKIVVARKVSSWKIGGEHGRVGNRFCGVDMFGTQASVGHICNRQGWQGVP